MPDVAVELTRPGVARAHKARLVREIIDTRVRVLGKAPASCHDVIRTVEEAGRGLAGELTDDGRGGAARDTVAA
jgi:4-oxalocrotonate tautomerase